jgi:hypothetical protein
MDQVLKGWLMVLVWWDGWTGRIPTVHFRMGRVALKRYNHNQKEPTCPLLVLLIPRVPKILGFYLEYMVQYLLSYLGTKEAEAGREGRGRKPPCGFTGWTSGWGNPSDHHGIVGDLHGLPL